MSMDSTTAGQPGAPRCSEAATGQVFALETQIQKLQNDLWDVHALLRGTKAQLTAFEIEGTDTTNVGDDAADVLRRLLSLAMDTLYELAATGQAREWHHD